MYGAGDALPEAYRERFRTQIYSDRVIHPGVWNKVVVVAREDDDGGSTFTQESGRASQ